jgi:gliding motility-associated-like protein
MFKKILLLFLFLVPALRVYSQVPTSGLVGAWPFSGNANDVSGTGNHGTVNGATLTADRCGNANSAYSFNGTNNYIIMNSAGPTGTVSRSISFWAKTSNMALSPVVGFDYGVPNGIGGNYQIVFNYNCLGVGIDISNQALIRANNCLYNNAWHHIVAVYNSTVSTQIGSVLFYIDGVLMPNVTCSVGGTTAVINTVLGNPINIGRGVTNVRFFNGQLDDFYLYNRVISPTEVMQLYTALPCTIAVTGPSTTCAGGTYNYSVTPITGASTYSWVLPGGWSGTSTSNTISVTSTTSSGLVSVYGIPTGTCGNVGAASMSVTSILNSTVNVTSLSPSLCLGSTTSLTASGALNYTWQPSNNTSSLEVISPTVSTIYTVLSVDANGCTGTTSFTQSVLQPPALSITPSSSLTCPGSNVTLTATGALNYTWQPGSLTGSAVVVSPAVVTVYTLEGQDVNTCSNTTSYTQNILSVAAYTVNTSGNSICLGRSATVSVSGGSTYTWQPGGLTGSTVVITPSISVVYTISGTAVSGCTNTTTYIQAVNPNPTVVITPFSLTICPQTSTVLTGTGANTYTWSPIGVSGTTLAVSPTAATVYTVIGSTAAGCTATATRTVSLKLSPNLSFNTFSITCGSLGSATVSASGAIGPYSYSWNPTAQSGSIATGLFPGVYTLTVFDNGTGCTKTSTTNFLPLVPLTGTVSATNSVLCYGDATGTAAIALSGGSATQNYTWTTSLGAQNAATATQVPAGINTVVVSDALTHCTVTKTFVVTQPPALTLNIAASHYSVCMGNSISFTASTSGGIPGYSHVWVAGPSTTTHTVAETTNGLYTYSVQGTDANNCVITKTIGASFVPNPTLSVTQSSICPLETASLQATGATTYTWNNGQIGTQMVHNPMVTTEYTVIGTALACTAAATSSIILKPVPTVTFTSSAPVCYGDSLKFNAVGAMQSYTWTGPSFFTSSQQNPLIPFATLPNAGVYLLKVMAPNSCTNSLTQTLTVNALPFVAVSGSTVCENANLMLYSTTTASSTLLWSGPGGYTAAVQNPILALASQSMSGTYTLQATSVAGCINSAVTSASVIALPVLSITANSQTFCAGATLSMQAGGGQSYSWLGPWGFFNYQPFFSINNLAVASSGVYSLSSTNGPCQVSDTIRIWVYPLPTPSLSSNSPVCEGTTLQLSASGGSLYQWQSPSAQISTLSTISMGAASFSDAGVYTVTLTSGFGCVKTASSLVQVLPNPLVVVRPDTVCLGETAMLSVSGGTAYAWTGPAGFSATTPTILIAQVSSSTAGVYSVVVTGSNACTTSSTVMLTGNAFPLPIPLITIPKKICVGSSVSLEGTGGVSYVWTGPFNYSSNTATAQLVVSSNKVEGVYTLSVRDANTCPGSATVQIKVFPQPVGTLLSSAGSLCLPFWSEFRVKGIKGKAPIVSAIFSSEGATINDTIARFYFKNSGVYTITATFRDTNTCTNTVGLLIEGNPRPVAAFDYTPERPEARNDEVVFINGSYGPGNNRFYWLFKENGSDTIKVKNPVYTFNEPGMFPVVLLVENNWGCRDTAIKYIIVGEEFTLFVPDAFTPNGDGINDFFQAKGMGINKYSILIFDRWGEKVFSSENFADRWDGTYRSHLCEDNVYVWKIQLTDTHGRSKVYTGKVNLLR